MLSYNFQIFLGVDLQTAVQARLNEEYFQKM